MVTLGLVQAIITDCVLQVLLLDKLLHIGVIVVVHLPLGEALVAAWEVVVSLELRVVFICFDLISVCVSKDCFKFDAEIRVSNRL